MPGLRWGFLGAAGIARKNWEAIRNSGSGEIAGVASRDPARARQFIDECQGKAPFSTPPRVFSDYEGLITSPEIDAVYIPLPTGLRKDWVIRAAAAGKHVLCEKPCAASAADLRQMLAACREHHVLFMDGVMFMHSGRLPAMRALLEDGESVGPLRRVTSMFSFNAAREFFETNIRAQAAFEPHGCLGDLGWYCIRLALWSARGALPQITTGRILEQAGPSSPVPAAFSGELVFDHGLSSSFYCAFGSGVYQWARLDGEKGAIFLDDFVIPAKEAGEAGFCHGGRRITVNEQAERHATAQETKMFRTFARLAQSGGGYSEDWAAIALKTQQIQDALYQSALREGIALNPATF